MGANAVETEAATGEDNVIDGAALQINFSQYHVQ
jgi:hypothetical protein